MATYYVRPGGSDSNAGTGPATNQAWATIQKALGNTSGVVGGDIIYVAPGHYFEQVVVGFTSPSSTVQIIGDVTASQFTGMTAGIVRLSGFSSAGNAAIVYTPSILKGTSKNNLSFSNFIFEGKGTGSTGNGLVTFLTSQNISFIKCLFSQQGYDGTANTGAVLQLTAPSTLPLNATISKCVFEGARLMCSLNGSNVADASSVKDCIFFSGNFQLYTRSCQVTVINNTFSGCYGSACDFALGSASFPSTFRNNLFLFNVVGISCASTDGTEDYNRFIGTQSARNGIGTGSNSSTVGSSRLTYGFLRILGLAATDFWSPEQNSPNQGFGTATGAEATDVYSTAWVGATPDAGYQTYSVSTNLAPTYYPTERNASTITISPGATSQSIELYLGATGLTASTSGLSAYYNRTRTADVQIPLVARVIDGSNPSGVWTAGGFAEVNASTMPGVYRLDLPDAAVAAGADDVTVVVRGASGTNGAVMTIKLSSGGLTAAQTAQAVLDAVASTHNNIGSIGAFIQDKSGYSLATSQSFNTTGSVGSITGNVTGNVVGTVGGVVGNITGSVATVANPDNIIDGVWDEQRTGHTAAGSFGEKLQTNALADEMLARDLGSGLNAGTAEERTVRSALRALRNKVNVGSSQMVVKKEDDSTDAWTATVTTTAVSSNVSGIDPN
jgi:hypothetical protein